VNKKGLVPALGYLIRYQDLLDKANAGKISTAEMALLLNFDQGNLYSYQQARDLSVALLEEWLVKYKFKDWKKTETTRKKVTLKMKRDRAKEIAEKLNEPKRWNSHGIGIGMERIRRDLNLKIDDFGENEKLNENVRRYHKILTGPFNSEVQHAESWRWRKPREVSDSRVSFWGAS
jgi:hypothetical protein